MTSDDGTVTIFLKFEIDEDSAGEAKENARKILSDGLGIPVNAGLMSGGGTDADPKADSRKSKDASDELGALLKNYIKENKRELTVKAIKQGEVAISSSLKKGFGIVEDIYARLKASSPLLQAIESLFQLAVQLVFMPIGNKLGEVLIPATMDLLDNVVELMDKFEGKTLGEMFSIAINEGVKLFGSYFTSIGDILESQGDKVSGIGTLLKTIGEFIEGPAAGVLNTILTVTSFMLSHLKEFVALYIALKTAELAMQATGVLGWVGANAGIFTAVSAFLAGGASLALMSGMGMATGGKVPSTPGGQLRVLGEGGEDEYVFPESKLDSVGGGNYTINVYGYTDSELKTIVQDIVNEQIAQSRIRSGF